jgi:hypothetical protein
VFSSFRLYSIVSLFVLDLASTLQTVFSTLALRPIEHCNSVSRMMKYSQLHDRLSLSQAVTPFVWQSNQALAAVVCAGVWAS